MTPATSKSTGKGTTKNNGDSKPLTTFAPPPMSAVVSIVVFIGVAIYYLPTGTDVPPEIFVNRVFPEYLSVEAMLFIRAFFALVCFGGFASGWLTADVTVSPPYRPQSKVARLPFVLKGWSKQYPFTSWSWNLLGVSFALSTYVGYTVHQTGTIEPWLARLTLIVWEVSAPMTLLVGAVVKYALWPAQIKETGHGATFLLPRALLQHNANVIMAVTDLALMSGIPTRIADIPISVIYGCSYVLFSWVIQNVWHGQGPAFIYFFMDCTLGTEHTIALYVLLAVLMIFYGVFCGVESIFKMMGGSVLGHAGFAFVLCAAVCRFRD